MEKEGNGRLDTLTTTTLQRVYRILEIMFKFMFFQMTKDNSKTCKKFDSEWVVYFCILKVLFFLPRSNKIQCFVFKAFQSG